MPIIENLPESAQLILSFGFVSVLVAAGVQWIKNWASARNFHPLIVLAVISIVGGVIYAILQGAGVWEVVVQYTLVIGSVANTIYTVLNAVLEKATGGEKTLSRGDI